MTNLLFDTWKRQLDVGLNVMEAVVEGAVRMRECQLEAAAQSHADLEATRKAIAAAPDLPALLKLQADWTRANAERSLAYWRSLYQCVADTDAAVVKCAGAAAPLRAYQPLEKAAA